MKNLKQIFSDDPDVLRSLQDRDIFDVHERIDEVDLKLEEKTSELSLQIENIELHIPEKGDIGESGKDGADGHTPIKNVDYFDGEDGKPGKNGIDGYTPIKGLDYFDGKVGDKGDRGDTGETPTIESIIDEIKKGKHIEVRDIKGLPINMNDQRWHGGGISNITGLIQQGTNITITGSGTKSDPYVINSSGGAVAVTSVSNSDGTLIISPTTGNVVSSLNLSHTNTWIGQQTFNTFPTIHELGAITPKVYPLSDSTSALGVYKADGTTRQLIFDTTNTRAFYGSVNTATSPYAPLTNPAFIFNTRLLIQDQNTVSGDRTPTVIENKADVFNSGRGALYIYPQTSDGNQQRFFIGHPTSGNQQFTLNLGGVNTIEQMPSFTVSGLFGITFQGASHGITRNNNSTLIWSSGPSSDFRWYGSAFFNVPPQLGGTLPEIMRLDTTNGRLGIGTAAPTEILEVAGNALVSGDMYVNGLIKYLPGSAVGIDLSNTYLLDSSALPTMLWANRQMIDTSGLNSMNWGSRQLLSTDGTTAMIDWSNNTMMGNYYFSGGILQGDGSGLTNINVSQLKDASTLIAVDANTRGLYEVNGSTIFLDFSNSTASGAYNNIGGVLTGPGQGMGYIPANSAYWSGDPTTLKEAIDRLASVVSAGGTIPIP